MDDIRIDWVSGIWVLNQMGLRTRVDGNRGWLDQWLAERGKSCGDLDFGGSKALEQKFVHDFGPLVEA